MRLLVIVLKESKAHLDVILEPLTRLGVTGATIIDAVGMGRVMHHEVPIFMGLRHIMGSRLPYNKVILSVIGDDVNLEEIRTVVEEVVGSLDEPGTGIIFTVPLIEAFGAAIEEL